MIADSVWGTGVEEYVLAGDGPEGAGALEIFASIEPRHASIEVRRSPGQRVPVLMHDGMRSILARPSDDRLYITRREAVSSFRLVVLRWLD
ncbi:MAG: hypothetical protein RLW62_24020 [Gammaproteobacteria bacterium]